MLSPDGVPLSRRYYSEESGRDLEDDQMVRGYEVADGKYVTVTDEELEKLAPKKSRDIDLRLFVDVQSIPPIYFERGYFLTPGGETEKAYRLLARTLEETGRAGVGTFVMRGKEHVVAIFSENGFLLAETLRFADELRTPADVGLPEGKRVEEASLSKFEKLIGRHSKDDLSNVEIKDTETNRLLKLVEAKEKRGKDVVESEETVEDHSNVIDIMDVLKKSIASKR